MKVLITGSNGFLGKNLQIYLSKRKDIEVICFTRDIHLSQLHSLIEGVDFVFHLAGANRPEDPGDFVIDNVELTKVLCEAIVKNGSMMRVIYASSVQSKQTSPYGLSKRAAEGALFELESVHGILVHIFRLPNIFGKWCKPNYNSVVATFCHNIARDLPIQIYDPNSLLILIYVEDLIERFLQIMDGADNAIDHDGFEILSPQYTITVGALANLIKAFKHSHDSLMVEQVGTGLERDLYSTYVSYLPPEKFAHITPQYKDQSSVFVEVLKTPDYGQLSFVTVPPGSKIGKDFHNRKIEKFLVIKGHACFRFCHSYTGEVYELETAGDRHEIITTVPGWALDVTNISNDEMTAIFWSNEPLNQAELVTSFSSIQYKSLEINHSAKRILILGASGMLGNALLRFFSCSPGFQVFGTIRSILAKDYLPLNLQDKTIILDVVENLDGLERLLRAYQPDVLVNCIGIVKQISQAENVTTAIPVNALFPHQLAKLCDAMGVRLIHMSTDCVFSGTKGGYTEEDIPDAKDLYGISKFLGEINYPNAVTLRTSLIGHELKDKRSLINWFLSQKGIVTGFEKAIFSGLPTVEIARIIRDFIIPNPELHGLYHISADPINKYDLLCLVAKIYGHDVKIIPNQIFAIDRSLDSSYFRKATGFRPESWPELIRRMNEFG